MDVRPGGSLLIAALPDGGVLLGLGNPVAAALRCGAVRPSDSPFVTQAPDGVEQITVTNATELSHPQLSRIVPVRSDGADGSAARSNSPLTCGLSSVRTPWRYRPSRVRRGSPPALNAPHRNCVDVRCCEQT